MYKLCVQIFAFLCFLINVRVCVAVVRSRSGPDRLEGQQPGPGSGQSSAERRRPPECREGRRRQEEQPQLPGEEEGMGSKRTRHVSKVPTASELM